MHGERPQFITAREAAELLSVSERTIWRWVAEGNFARPIRFGRCTRFERADVLAWARGAADLQPA